MRHIFLITLLTICSSGWAQTLKEATKYFEKYEYKKAAATYEAVARQRDLPEEDYKRLAYAYFVNGQYGKCLPLSDSILNMNDPSPFFYYVNGEVNMGNRNYEKAKESFVKYSKMDDEYDVSIKIASCDAIPTWEQEVHLKNQLFSNNTTKADISGPQYEDGIVLYKEIGMDSSGVSMEMQNIDNSELILARPYIGGNYESLRQIVLKDSVMNNISVSSISLSGKSDEVWLTINQPLAEDPMDMAHHLYIGKYATTDKSVSDITLWDQGGYNDTSACAHATVNASGDFMVFTKIGQRTQGADLYSSQKINGVWSIPSPIAELNTKMDDMYPMFIGDSLLSFSSNGRPGYGHLDIFLAEVSGKTFGEVRHLKAPVNSFMDDFNFHYYDSQDSARYTSNRENGVGDDDIYFVKFSEPVGPDPVVDDSSDFKEFVDNWDIPKIYFEFDKFELEKDFNKLDELVAFLKKYPKSSIIVEGHTDRRGSIDYNYNLGYKRAERVSKEITQAGVSGGQISIKSKGKKDPQIDCDVCTEADHAKNRVVLIMLNAK